MSEIKATWTVELYCDCPKCKEFVDLLEFEDFWDGRSLDVGESDTERSMDMNVVCPKCMHEFIVDLYY